MVGQKYFKGANVFFGGQKYTKYDKINNNSENFRRTRLLLEEICPPSSP